MALIGNRARLAIEVQHREALARVGPKLQRQVILRCIGGCEDAIRLAQNPAQQGQGAIHYGTLTGLQVVAPALNAIGNTISNFNCFAGQAINLGLAAVVSQCVGAGEFDQARAYLRKIVKWTYGIMAAVNLTIIALLPLIMRVYNVSPEAEKLAVTVTLIHGISSIFIWVPAFMVPGFLRAAGDAKFTMLASMLTMWVVRVLLAYVLGKYMGYGVIGVWFAHAIVDWSVRGAIFFLRYRSGKWETMGIKT